MTPELAERLTKIILMLDNESDGETVNAARMLVRALRSEKLDLHDLTDALALTAKRSAPKAVAYNADPTAVWSKPTPESVSESLGMVDERGYLTVWKSLVAELLKLNQKIPKRYGGKCLMPHQVLILQRIQHGGTPTLAEVSSIRRMDKTLREARRAQEADMQKTA